MIILKEVVKNIFKGLGILFAILFYYVLQVIGGLLFYPYGDLVDIARTEKYLIGMERSTLFIFLIGTFVVTFIVLFKYKKWPFKYYMNYVYLNYIIIHFSFMFNFLRIRKISLENHILSAVLIEIVLMLVHYLMDKRQKESLEVDVK